MASLLPRLLVVRTVAADANRIAYTGRIGKCGHEFGAQRATLVATDAAGNRSAPARISFRVVRR